MPELGPTLCDVCSSPLVLHTATDRVHCRAARIEEKRRAQAAGEVPRSNKGTS